MRRTFPWEEIMAVGTSAVEGTFILWPTTTEWYTFMMNILFVITRGSWTLKIGGLVNSKLVMDWTPQQDPEHDKKWKLSFFVSFFFCRVIPNAQGWSQGSRVLNWSPSQRSGQKENSLDEVKIIKIWQVAVRMFSTYLVCWVNLEICNHSKEKPDF